MPQDQDRTPSTPYFGPERRTGQDRRQGGDRREQFRFEPAAPGRRNGRDRRRTQGWDGTLLR